MQVILFLMGLFAIGCILYGIAAGVQVFQNGFTRLAVSVRSRNSTHSEKGALSKQPVNEHNRTGQETFTTESAGSATSRSLEELRLLFSLYQQGALSKEEFDVMKRSLLASVADPATAGR